MRTLLRIEEVAVSCGVSVQTINNWYKFKAENPNNEYAQLLPNYIQVGGKKQRFWDKSDIPNLLQFKNSLPTGCKGVMGSVTQRYVVKTPKKKKQPIVVTSRKKAREERNRLKEEQRNGR